MDKLPRFPLIPAICTGLAYYSAAKFSVAFATLPAAGSTPVWIASGIAVGSLFIWGNAVLWGLIPTVLVLEIQVFNGWQSPGLGLAIAITSVVILGKWGAAYLIKQVTASRDPLHHPEDVLRLLGIGAFASHLAVGAICAGLICLSQRAPWSAYGTIAVTWWLSDAFGIVMVTPLMLAWNHRPLDLQSWLFHRWGEALGLTLGILGICFAAFRAGYPLEYMILPMLLWATFRLSLQGATLLMFLGTFIALIGTAHGYGSFVRSNMNESLLLLQSFIGVINGTVLLVGAMLHQNREADRQLRQANQTLEQRVEHRTQDLKRSQEQLRQSETLLRLTLEHVPIGIITLDLQGKILQANQAFRQMVGYTTQAGTDRSFFELIHPLDQSTFQQQWLALISKNQEILKGETRYINEDGETLEIAWQVVLLCNSNGDPIQLIAELEDITDRKRSETEQQRLLETERKLSALKSKFVAMTSHEFRTPLGIISSSSAILEDYGPRLSYEQQQKHFYRIQNAVTHMTELLEEVITLGKVDSDTLKLSLTPIDVGIFCRNLIEEVTLAHPDTSTIHLTLEDCDRSTYLDRRILRQILTNLLSNALKYSSPHKPVTLRVHQRAKYIYFEVQDGGIGIPSQDLPFLFEPFHRANNVGTRPGTGLGLSIVKRLVELHQGEIQCESQLGEGTLFRVSLPQLASPLSPPLAP
jgi:PAS domain S-box-containing protein